MEGLALLYSLWKELPAAADSGPRTFEAFMPWGRIALRDFNEIDQHLLDAQSVFQNLCDIEGIEDWSFGDPDSLKPGQQAFLRQYMQLGPLYAAFTAALAERSKVTLGCWPAGGERPHFRRLRSRLHWWDERPHPGRDAISQGI